MEDSETLTSSYVLVGEVKASVVNCVHQIVHLACFNQHAFLGHEDSLVSRDLSAQPEPLFCCQRVRKQKRAIFQEYTKADKQRQFLVNSSAFI